LDVAEAAVHDDPSDLLVVGPSARVIARQGSVRVVLLQPALLGELIIVHLVVELGPDHQPVPELDKRLLSLKPSLTALDEEPVRLWLPGWISGGGYRELSCLATFEAAGHAHAPLRLDVELPLLEQPVSYVFTLARH
jgi:hypothetical protein